MRKCVPSLDICSASVRRTDAAPTEPIAMFGLGSYRDIAPTEHASRAVKVKLRRSTISIAAAPEFEPSSVGAQSL
jgi:hypothetical protein